MGTKQAHRVADQLLKERVRDRAAGALDDIAALTREDVIVTSGCW